MLTPQQLKLLKFIESFHAERGVIPSYEEMKTALGLKSKSGIAGLIQALENKRYIRRLANKARALEILKPTLEVQPPARYTGDNVLDGGSVQDFLGPQAAPASIPLCGDIAAGLPLHVFEQEGERVDLPKSLLSVGRTAHDYFALRVVGNSMIEAGIMDGDIVVLLKTNQAKTGDVVAALIDHDEVTLKRFHLMPESIILEPANKDFMPQEYTQDRVQIMGRLAHLIRKYD